MGDRWPKFRRKWLWAAVLVFLATAVLAVVLISSLNRALSHASTVACSSNLRQLGLALQLYAAEHHKMLPSSWQQLAENQELTADVFLCPGDFADGRAPGATTQEWARHVDQPAGAHCAYVLAGGFAMPEDKNFVLAFERIGGHSQWGVNLLFADGHVEQLSIGKVTREREQYDRLLADYAAGVRPLRIRE